MHNKQKFIQIFELLEKKYKYSPKRLAAQGWAHPWQVLITTIMSAQNRDENTIIIGESLFQKYPFLESLSKAKEEDILKIFKSLNYNKTKAKHVIKASKYLLEKHKGKVPENLEDLIKIPGVGMKTANLLIAKVHKKPAICVDTHVHRICNVLGFVKTKNPDDTEKALKEFIPQQYWTRINRYFVLWGKEISGRDKIKLLSHLGMDENNIKRFSK